GRGAAHGVLAVVRVDRRLQRRMFGQRGGLLAIVALARGLAIGHALLADRHVGGNRLRQPVARLPREQQEHGSPHQRNDAEAEPQNLRDQTRGSPTRPARHRHSSSAMGRRKDRSTGSPGVTETIAVTLPTRSCQATTLWAPGASPAMAKRPSASGIAKYG